MSIQVCAWPCCPARFPRSSGPTTYGWRLFTYGDGAVVALCPFHSSNGHSPLIVNTNTRNRPTRMACSCKEWVSDPIESFIGGIREWQIHVRSTAEDR